MQAKKRHALQYHCVLQTCRAVDTVALPLGKVLRVQAVPRLRVDAVAPPPVALHGVERGAVVRALDVAVVPLLRSARFRVVGVCMGRRAGRKQRARGTTIVLVGIIILHTGAVELYSKLCGQLATCVCVFERIRTAGSGSLKSSAKGLNNHHIAAKPLKFESAAYAASWFPASSSAFPCFSTSWRRRRSTLRRSLK